MAVPLARVFAPDPGIANNHLLNTLLARWTTGLLGPSELSLRLPSLLGGVLYLIAVRRLVVLLFGSTLLGLLCLLALTLDPLVLDFMSAARGYGMALAFDVWALPPMLRLLAHGLDPPGAWHERTTLLGIAMLIALSSVANLAFLPVNAGLVVSFGAFLLVDELGARGPASCARRALRLLLWLALPGTAVFAAAVFQPHLAHFDRTAYFVGVPTLADTTRSLVRLSLRHHPSALALDTRSARFDAIETLVVCALVPAVLLLAAAVCARRAVAWRRRRGPLSGGPAAWALPLVTGALVVSLAILVVLHAVGGMLYPADRTGLQLLVLFSLASCCLVQAAPVATVAGAWARRVGLVALTLLVLQYGVQLDVGRYAVWAYDASTKRFVATIEARHAGHGGTVRLAASWWLGPSVRFYRATRNLTWLLPESPRVGRPLSDLRLEVCDYYMAVGGDRRLVQALGPITLAEDPLAGTLLAARATGRAAMPPAPAGHAEGAAHAGSAGGPGLRVARRP